jgi:hypothetical protein
MESHARHPNFKDKVAITRDDVGDGYDKFHDIIVEDIAGKKLTVDCRDLKFDYHILESE